MIFKKYRELFYFIIVFSFLQTAKKKEGVSYLLNARYALLAGMTTLMLISYGMYFGLVPMKGVDYAVLQQIPRIFFRYSQFIVNYSTVHHIVHSFFMAMLSFWALQEIPAKEQRKSKVLTILFSLLFILATINVFFVSSGRSGMVIYTLLAAVFIVQRCKLRQTVFALLLICGLLTVSYFSSENMALRVDTAIEDIRNYRSGTSRSSLGMRLDWWQDSLILIRNAPLAGYGTGSFATEQKKLVAGTTTKPSDNPHNEYLMLGVQLGIPGIVIFIAMLGALFFYSFSLFKKERHLLQGTVLAFAWGCLANSWLLDSHPSHFFLIAAAILTSGATNRERGRILNKNNQLPAAQGQQNG